MHFHVYLRPLSHASATGPFLRCAAVSLMTVVLSAGAHAQQKTPHVVRIGFASPLTGPQAHYGADNLNGARMAIDALNARGALIGKNAVRFELIPEDDQADPKTGTIVAQRLADAGVRGVVGHFNSGVTIPASRIYNDAGIPQISVSTNPKYTRQGYATAFRIMADDDKQGAMLGEYAVRRLGFASVAVVDDRTAYGQGLADAFAGAVKSAGARVVKREYVSDKDFDFRAVLTVLKSGSPPAVFFAGYDAQAGPLARQMRELGLKATLLGGETINTAKFLELAGPAAEGHVASTPGAPLAKPSRRRGVRRELPDQVQAGDRPLCPLLLRWRHAARACDGGGRQHGAQAATLRSFGAFATTASPRPSNSTRTAI